MVDRLLAYQFDIGGKRCTFYGRDEEEATRNARVWAKKHDLPEPVLWRR